MIRYYLDGVLIGTNSAGNYSDPYSVSFTNIENGFHTVKARVSDDLGNSAEDSITLNFLLPQQPPNITWISPRDNATYFLSSLPLTIKGEVSRFKDARKISIIYSKDDIQITSEIFENPEKESLEFKWGENIAAGNYQIYAQIENMSGQTYRSNILNLEILE